MFKVLEMFNCVKFAQVGWGSGPSRDCGDISVL